MSGKVFDDLKRIFQQIGIQMDDEDELVTSVYTLVGFYDYRKVEMCVALEHHYWPHFSKIWIDEITVPIEKISAAYELISRINSLLVYDHFKIDPESGEIGLYAGFYSGMVGCDEDEEELNDGLDTYSFMHIRMLIYQMIRHFSLFSPLFNTLTKTDKLPSVIIEEFWNKLSKKNKAELREYL